MNILEVLGVIVVGYFIFVALWLTKIEDYLADAEENRTKTQTSNRGEPHGE